MTQEFKQLFSTPAPTARSTTRRRRRKSRGKLHEALESAVAWLRSRRLAPPPRKLRVCESVSLGEKRFAAVLEYEDQRFLIGGAAQSVQLLTELSPSRFSKAVLDRQKTGSEVY